MEKRKRDLIDRWKGREHGKEQIDPSKSERHGTGPIRKEIEENEEIWE